MADFYVVRNLHVRCVMTLALLLQLANTQDLQHEEEMHAFLGDILKLPQWQQQELREFKQKLAEQSAKKYMQKLREMGLKPPAAEEEVEEKEFEAAETPPPLVTEASKKTGKQEETKTPAKAEEERLEKNEAFKEKQKQMKQKAEERVQHAAGAVPKAPIARSQKKGKTDRKQQKGEDSEDEGPNELDGSMPSNAATNHAYEFGLYVAFTAWVFLMARAAVYIYKNCSGGFTAIEAQFWQHVESCSTGQKKGWQSKVFSKLVNLVFVAEATDALESADSFGNGEKESFLDDDEQEL